jgi:hypothetical protein
MSFVSSGSSALTASPDECCMREPIS